MLCLSSTRYHWRGFAHDPGRVDRSKSNRCGGGSIRSEGWRLADRSKPFGEELFRPFLKMRSVPSGVLSELGYGQFGGGDLARVSDEPLLEARRRGLRMELERERIGAQRKCLVAAEGRGGEQRRALRQIERIAVPVQHRRVVSKMAQWRFAAFGGQRNRRPSYFLCAGRIDAGAQRPRHQLRAETDPDCRTPRRQPFFQQIDRSEERRVGKEC